MSYHGIHEKARESRSHKLRTRSPGLRAVFDPHLLDLLAFVVSATRESRVRVILVFATVASGNNSHHGKGFSVIVQEVLVVFLIIIFSSSYDIATFHCAGTLMAGRMINDDM